MLSKQPSNGRRGFTLLEVLVSVAILGLALTAILSAQYSAVKSVEHSRHMSVATGLARCKMSEIEQDLSVDGFQELDQASAGPCCEGDDSARMSCEWRIEKPTFPEPQYGQLDLDAKIGGDSAVGRLAQGAQDGSLNDAKSLGDVAGVLGGGSDNPADAAAAGIGGVAGMVMGMVYPELKSIFEASTRRVTVMVVWQEGNRSYDLEVVQWVTKPQPGLAAYGEENEDGENPFAPGANGSSGSNGSSGNRTTMPRSGGGR